MYPFLAGILAFLSPCIVPMVSLYLSLITGLTLEELIKAETSQVKKDLLANTLIFVAVPPPRLGGAAFLFFRLFF
jgi:cytochrome c-type biogenesis protein